MCNSCALPNITLLLNGGPLCSAKTFRGVIISARQKLPSTAPTQRESTGKTARLVNAQEETAVEQKEYNFCNRAPGIASQLGSRKAARSSSMADKYVYGMALGMTARAVIHRQISSDKSTQSMTDSTARTKESRHVNLMVRDGERT